MEVGSVHGRLVGLGIRRSLPSRQTSTEEEVNPIVRQILLITAIITFSFIFMEIHIELIILCDYR